MEDEGKELDFDADKFIDFALERNSEDRGRAEDAGASRQKIGQFIDQTGINGKALSWGRQILKVNDKKNGEQKAIDIILSLEEVLPAVKNHVLGQGTGQLGLGDPADYEAEGDEPPADDPDDDLVPVGDEDIDDEAQAFEANLADLDEGDDSNVTPLNRAAE